MNKQMNLFSVQTTQIYAEISQDTVDRKLKESVYPQAMKTLSAPVKSLSIISPPQAVFSAALLPLSHGCLCTHLFDGSVQSVSFAAYLALYRACRILKLLDSEGAAFKSTKKAVHPPKNGGCTAKNNASSPTLQREKQVKKYSGKPLKRLRYGNALFCQDTNAFKRNFLKSNGRKPRVCEIDKD